MFVRFWCLFGSKRCQTMLWCHNARVNSHQRWKQTRNRVCFHLWCKLTLALWLNNIVWCPFGDIQPSKSRETCCSRDLNIDQSFWIGRSVILPNHRVFLLMFYWYLVFVVKWGLPACGIGVPYSGLCISGKYSLISQLHWEEVMDIIDIYIGLKDSI